MGDPKELIDKVIEKVKRGEIPPENAWQEIGGIKNDYLKDVRMHHPKIKDPEQSWHSYIGHRFESLIYEISKSYIENIKRKDRNFQNLEILREKELKKDDILFRKIAVKYSQYLLVPDTDMAIVEYDIKNPWNSKVLAVISCKTSLRERIAQACYWKLKFLSSDVTKNIRVYLVTTDNDKDFEPKRNKESYDGKSRNRVIAEYELDGVYILKEEFTWESNKIKRYEKFFEDLINLFNSTRKID
ncbi:MAG: BsaWI family type II restriction enzyme [Candidatus Jordarchaeaceae archaeon]